MFELNARSHRSRELGFGLKAKAIHPVGASPQIPIGTLAKLDGWEMHSLGSTSPTGWATDGAIPK